MIKFRTETTYGNGGHKPAEILAYETLSLGNIGILEDLYTKYKKAMSEQERKDIENLLSLIEHDQIDIFDESFDYSPYIPVYETLLKAIEKTKGHEINYLLWLTDLPNLLTLYYDVDQKNYLEDIDAYETGTEIVHIEGDGNLYAYAKKPEPLNKDVVKEYLDNYKGLYKVYVYPNVGAELQTIYFDHNDISIEELAAYCYANQKGYWLTKEDYIESRFDLDEDDQEYIDEVMFNDDQYVYVDLSEYNGPEIMFLVANLKTEEGVEVHS